MNEGMTEDFQGYKWHVSATQASEKGPINMSKGETFFFFNLVLFFCPNMPKYDDVKENHTTQSGKETWQSSL